jgi:hypothetical protein
LPTFKVTSENYQTPFTSIETLYNTTMGSTLNQPTTQNDLLTNTFTYNSNNSTTHPFDLNLSYNRDIILLSKDADLLSRKANLIANLTGDFSLKGSTSNAFYYNVSTTPINNQNLVSTFNKNSNLTTKFGYFIK